MLRRTYRLAERLVLPGYRLVRGFVGRFTMTWRARRRPCRIVVGANGIFDRGWIPTDVEYLNLLRQEHWERYFVEGSIDSILAEHVWEHLTEAEGLDVAARNAYHEANDEWASAEYRMDVAATLAKRCLEGM